MQRRKNNNKKINSQRTNLGKITAFNGGKLELPKFFWCMVMWRWVGGLPKLTTCKQAPTHLKIIQTETRKKKTVTIKRIETTDFERVLGVRMDIAGTWKGEIAE